MLEKCSRDLSEVNMKMDFNQGHRHYKRMISDIRGQNNPKWPKKWCFLTSVAKRVLGIIKRLLEYDIEYYGTPSGSYGLVPTCPQHTCRGRRSKNFFHNFLSFLCKNRDFFGPCFGPQPIRGGKIRQKFCKFFFRVF